MFKSLSQNWKRGTVSLGMALAMLSMIAFSAPSAQAATTAELQAQINALLAQIAQLNSGSSAGCYSFTRDLTVGAQGADVSTLQNFLAGKGYFHAVATGYFGPITASAVAQWQAANGVMPAAGYFGAVSRAKYNSLCYVAPNPKPTPGDDDDDDNGGFHSGNGDEASLEDFDTKSGDDADLEEGQEDGEILDFKFDVEDSDVEVQRVQVNFVFNGTSAGEDQPWKVFTGAHLLMDGDEVASVKNISQKKTWSKVSDDEYTIRFNGVDEVVKAGDTAEFTIAMDVANSVDGSNVGGANDWTVFIDDNAVRALDEAGIDQYTGDDSDIVTVSIDEAGNNNELKVSEGDKNPESTVFEVDDSKNSSWMTVAEMKLSAEGDIELNELPITVTLNPGQANDELYSEVVSDAQLVIGKKKYSDFSVSGAGTATATLTFDLSDEDVVIDDGDNVDVQVQLEFKKQSGNYDEGTTIQVTATSGVVDLIDAEGANDGEDLDVNQLDGSFEGEIHTLRNEGISVVLVDTDAVAPVGSDEAQANYKVEFKVTAFGSDWFIEKSSSRDADGIADNDDGVDFIIEGSDGTLYSSASSSVTSALSKSGNSSGDTATHYKISEGQTRTFTLQVSLDNDGADSGYYRARIIGIGFDSDGAGGTSSDLLSTGLENFDTRTVFVSGTDVNN